MDYSDDQGIESFLEESLNSLNCSHLAATIERFIAAELNIDLNASLPEDDSFVDFEPLHDSETSLDFTSGTTKDAENFTNLDELDWSSLNVDKMDINPSQTGSGTSVEDDSGVSDVNLSKDPFNEPDFNTLFDGSSLSEHQPPRHIKFSISDPQFRHRYKHDARYKHDVIMSEAYYNHHPNMSRRQPKRPDETKNEELHRQKSSIAVKRSYIKVKLDSLVTTYDAEAAHVDNVNAKRRLGSFMAYANTLLQHLGHENIDWISAWKTKRRPFTSLNV